MRCILIFAVILLFGCSKKEATVRNIEEFVERGIAGVDFNNPATLKVLGSPERSETITINNPHYEEVKDFVITEYYKGIVIKKYESPAFGKSVVFYCLLENPEVGLRGVRIKDDAKKIKRVFGNPTQELDSLIVFETSAGSEVLFYLENKRLKKVEWKLYID